MAANVQRTLYRGDTWILNVEVHPPGQSFGPQNITGYFCWCTIKARTTDPDSSALAQVTTASGNIVFTDPVQGTIQITIPSATTLAIPTSMTSVFYDVQLSDLSANISHAESGIITILPDVTLATQTQAPITPLFNGALSSVYFASTTTPLTTTNASSLSEGTLVYVNSLHGFVYLTRTSQFPTDNVNAFAAVPSGKWVRLRSQLTPDVKSDFGAIGDGVADDTVALQNALNYAASSGTSIYFPPGTYLISSMLDYDGGPSGIRIHGEHMDHSATTGATVIKWAGPNGGCMLRLRNATSTKIDHLCFLGYGGNSITPNGAAICIWWSTDPTIGNFGATDEFLMDRVFCETAGGIGSLTPKTISAASNTTPIVLTLNNVTGLVAGAAVKVAGVGGNLAANRSWILSNVNVGGSTVTLKDSVGNGGYSGGGTLVGWSTDVLCGSSDIFDVSQGRIQNCFFTGPIDTSGNAHLEYNVAFDGQSGNTKDFYLTDCALAQTLLAAIFCNCDNQVNIVNCVGGTVTAGNGATTISGGQIAVVYVVANSQVTINNLEYEGGSRLLYAANPGGNPQSIVIDQASWTGSSEDFSSIVPGAVKDVSLYCGGSQLMLRGVQLLNRRNFTTNRTLLNVTACSGNGVSPIVFTANTTNSGIVVGSDITVSGVANNNGPFLVTNVTPTNVTVAGTGNGSYGGSGGTILYNTPPNMRVGGDAIGLSSVSVEGCYFLQASFLPLQDVNGVPYGYSSFSPTSQVRSIGNEGSGQSFVLRMYPQIDSQSPYQLGSANTQSNFFPNFVQVGTTSSVGGTVTLNVPISSGHQAVIAVTVEGRCVVAGGTAVFGDSYGFSQSFLVKNVGGVVTIVGTLSLSTAVGDASQLANTLTTSIGTNSVNFVATQAGASNTGSIDWVILADAGVD